MQNIEKFITMYGTGVVLSTTNSETISRSQNGHNKGDKTMTHTIALPTPNDNEFEFLAAILATWDETSEGKLHKRQALDQLLVRSEIDGYEKSRVAGNRDLLKWEKTGSDLVVFVSRVGDGLYDVYVHTHNTRIRSLGIAEL